MTWEDRIKLGYITTPDNKIYDFAYEDLSTTRQNKTSQYLFSDESKALVQNWGLGVVDFPLTIFFDGPNYDEIAADFDESSALPGNSVLNHPIYGIKNVVIQSVTRLDALKSAANQAQYTLVITETIAEDKITSVIEIATNINANINALAILNGQILSIADYNLSDPFGFSSALSRWQNTLNQYRSEFGAVLSKADDLRAQFESAITSIEQTIDTLVLAPKNLFSAISQLAKIPARAATSIAAKLEGYSNLLSQFAVANTAPIAGTSQDSKNRRIEAQGHVNALLGGLAGSYVYAAENSTASESNSGIDNAVINVVETGIGFVTRSESISNAVTLIETFVNAQEYLDKEQQISEVSSLQTRFVVSPDTSQLLSEIIKQTAGNLIKLSFRLKQERIIELQNETTFINLCFDLYGSTKINIIDFFLATNNLEDNDFLLIPRGKVIKYYV